MLKLPYDYIRGLVEGEGTFTFSTTRSGKLSDGEIKKTKIPAFALKMHERDEELLRAVRNTLGLKNTVYNYYTPSKDGRPRGRQAMLIVREGPQIKHIIIPFFYKRLYGNKGRQFLEWLEKMGAPDTSPYTKFINRLYKSGWFDKNPKFLEELPVDNL